MLLLHQNFANCIDLSHAPLKFKLLLKVIVVDLSIKVHLHFLSAFQESQVDRDYSQKNPDPFNFRSLPSIFLFLKTGKIPKLAKRP